MKFIIKTTSEELQRARKWWNDLEMLWKFAYNEAVFGKGTVVESITNMQITSLKELRRHTQLEHLFVYENQLTSKRSEQFKLPN